MYVTAGAAFGVSGLITSSGKMLTVSIELVRFMLFRSFAVELLFISLSLLKSLLTRPF